MILLHPYHSQPTRSAANSNMNPIVSWSIFRSYHSQLKRVLIFLAFSSISEDCCTGIRFENGALTGLFLEF